MNNHAARYFAQKNIMDTIRASGNPYWAEDTEEAIEGFKREHENPSLADEFWFREMVDRIDANRIERGTNNGKDRAGGSEGNQTVIG